VWSKIKTVGKTGVPLTPIQALSIDMGTDSLTALGLGVERPDPQIMRLPPRSPSERLSTSSPADYPIF